MANDTETLADIVAQMRNPEGMGYTVGNTANGADISVATAICVATFADRIEAAWERERVEIVTKAATQGVKLTNEKWRSEFEAVDSLIAEGIATEVDEELQHPFHLEFAREKIAAALAAAPAVDCPPSNVAALRDALTPWVSLAEWLIENAGKEALGRGIAEIVPTLRKRIDESKSALATTEGGAA